MAAIVVDMPVNQSRCPKPFAKIGSELSFDFDWTGAPQHAELGNQGLWHEPLTPSPVPTLLPPPCAEDGSELSFDFGWAEHPGMLNNLRLAEMRAGEKPVVPAPLKCVPGPPGGRGLGRCHEDVFPGGLID